MEFSDKIKVFLEKEFPGKDIYKMSLDELKSFKVDVENKREEYMMLELAMKTLGNASYGSSANKFFYFYNLALAGDITGECKNLTTTMNNNFIQWFHEDIWERKDLWEQFDFALDESKHDWYRQQDVWIYSDTDSVEKDTMLLVKHNGKLEHKTIAQLFHDNYIDHKCVFKLNPNSTNEYCGSDDEVLNWTKERGLHFVPIKYIMKHNVSKAKFKIKTKSGKEVIVTGDHSCIVFRNGEQLTIKAKDINKETDKILSVITDEQK